MRTAPASILKGRRHRGPPIHDKPRDGTKLRAVYDFLMERKGLVIEVPLSVGLPDVFCKGNGRFIEDLRDYYGLDVRKMGHCRWLLAGEWFGRVYVDYVAERLTEKGVLK